MHDPAGAASDGVKISAALWRDTVFRPIQRGARADRTSASPLWVQVKNALGDTIRTSIPVDRRIPSEQALCSLFGVSRPVIREALNALVREGVLIKLPRRGVFTRRPRDDADFLTRNIGVFDDMTAKGHVVTTRTVDCSLHSASEAERRMLRLSPSAQVTRIRRVYLVDGLPLTLTTISIPAHRAPGLVERLSENQSIFALLRQRYGLEGQRAERWFTAITASPEMAARLEIAAGQPLIAVESIVYCANGEPLEYYDAVHNPDVARMHVVTTLDQPRG